MNTYELTVPQFVRVLTQASHWLDKAQAYAEQKKFKPEVLLDARLAPDQFHFTRQIQILCDQCKNATARLAGAEPQRFEDTETTLDELRARIARTIEYMNTFPREQFEGAEERRIVLPFLPMQGKYLLGSDFLIQFALPNVYFHATTAYAILRHNGVEVGKIDFMGPLPFRDA